MHTRLLPQIGLAWWLLLLGLLLGGRAWGAALTEAQLAILHDDMVAASDLAPFVAQGNVAAITTAYNLPATPEFWVWRTTLSKYSIYSLSSPTGSVWNWEQFKGLTMPEQQTWGEMFHGETGVTNYSLPNIRTGVEKLFTGAPPNVAQRAHVDAMGRRVATRVERLYVTGEGAPTAPGLLTWEGSVSESDIAKALALP